MNALERRQEKEQQWEVLQQLHKEAGHFFIDPLQEILNLYDVTHESNVDINQGWYEYTQTISPKAYQVVDKGEKYKNGRSKMTKEYYNLMSTKKQLRIINKCIRRYCRSEDITIIQTYEFQTNGNIHTHAICKHIGGYEVKLREMQQYFKRMFGRNSMSPVRKPYSWITYLLKDVSRLQIRPLVVNSNFIGCNSIDEVDIKLSVLKEKENMTIQQ